MEVSQQVWGCESDVNIELVLMCWEYGVDASGADREWRGDVMLMLR
jgi:hypothetical protein